MVALPEDDSKPYSIRLQLLDPEGTQQALVLINMQPVTQGPLKQGARAYGVEDNGVFDFEMKTDLQLQKILLNVSIRDLKGLPAVSVLEGLRFLQEFHEPNSLRVAQPYGPLAGAASPLPSGSQPLQVGFELLAVEALSVIQDFTSTQLLLPDLSVAPDADVRAWREAAALLLGETVASTWC